MAFHDLSVRKKDWKWSRLFTPSQRLNSLVNLLHLTYTGHVPKKLSVYLLGFRDATTLITLAKMGFPRAPEARHDIKRRNPEHVEDERPAKLLKTLLEEDDSSNEDDIGSSHDNGEFVRDDETGGHGFKVNPEFARRFEHNKKREELHKREYCFTRSHWSHVLT